MKKLGPPQPIRFAAGTRAKIAKLARRHRIKSSDLIRQAVAHKLSEWETAGVITISGHQD